MFSSDVSFDGLMLSQEALADQGEDLLRLEYDVLSLFQLETSIQMPP